MSAFIKQRVLLNRPPIPVFSVNEATPRFRSESKICEEMILPRNLNQLLRQRVSGISHNLYFYFTVELNPCNINHLKSEFIKR